MKIKSKIIPRYLVLTMDFIYVYLEEWLQRINMFFFSFFFLNTYRPAYSVQLFYLLMLVIKCFQLFLYVVFFIYRSCILCSYFYLSFYSFASHPHRLGEFLIQKITLFVSSFCVLQHLFPSFVYARVNNKVISYHKEPLFQCNPAKSLNPHKYKIIVKLNRVMQELYNNFGRFGGFYSQKTRMWIQQYKWKKFPAITWDTATETRSPFFSVTQQNL